MVMFDDPRDPGRLRPDRMPTTPTTPTPSLPPPPDNLVPGAGTWGAGSDRVRSRHAPHPSDSGATSLPSDIIGDIPPPPIPQPPIVGPGVAGIPGTEAGTFARPGSAAAMPFRTAGYAAARPQRFGPGAPIVGGGGGMSGFGGDEGGMGLGSPDAVAELLRALAAGRGGGPVA